MNYVFNDPRLGHKMAYVFFCVKFILLYCSNSSVFGFHVGFLVWLVDQSIVVCCMAIVKASA